MRADVVEAFPRGTPEEFGPQPEHHSGGEYPEVKGRTVPADGEWLDIVTWRSHEDFVASRAKGANLPGISAFFDAIAELVSSEEGTEDAYGQ